jgi:sugar phosphate isomerase/epimerase
MNQACIILALLAGLSPVATCAGPSESPRSSGHPFFAFCVDTHDSRKRNLEAQAKMLRDLGYDGVGHLWLDGVPERIATLDRHGLRLFQITVMVDIAPGKTAYDSRLLPTLPLLKGRDVQLALLMNGLRPSDPAGDERAVEILRELAGPARDSGVQLALYPHTAFWLEKFEDALRVAAKTDRKEVGIMFNLCHWLRVSQDRDFKPLLARAGPKLFAVSINGADIQDAHADWSRYIQPLGRGSFDVRHFLAVLDATGYSGAIGLQCYGIPGDTSEHLAESLAVWRSYGRCRR